jgi:hypothetical protein
MLARWVLSTAPSEPAALRFFRRVGTSCDADADDAGDADVPGVVQETVRSARALRTEAAILAAESELLRRRARRLAAASRRRVRELAWIHDRGSAA